MPASGGTPGGVGRDADLDAWLELGLALCDLADAMALEAVREQLVISAKDDGSFVTQVDRAIEALVRDRIADAYPTHGIVGEEHGEVVPDASVRWFVDPIDGTHNFMRGVPLFGTLLAAERDGDLVVGVVSAPALGRRWWARRGGGAWVREPGGRAPRRLHVSTRDRLAEWQVLYRSMLAVRASRVGPGLETLLGEVWRERAYGDFWGYTLVADGAAEMMVEDDLHVWDVAAPWVVVEEAGGRMTDLEGRRDWFAGEALATNGALHDEVLERLHR
jgi:histidinol-phosphatase